MRQRGFTYLGLLFFVALTAAALAALGQSWRTAAQRERERELAFRGQEIARAIASYAKASQGSAGVYPRHLQDLLLDRRGVVTRHHLRRLYTDPFTGQADWVLVPDPAQPPGFSAIHSRSEVTLLRQVQPDGGEIHQAKDWLFSAAWATAAAAPPPAHPASTIP